MADTISGPKRVRARKNTWCDWCGKPIPKGEEHTVSTCVDDTIYTFRECDRCKKYVDEMYEHYSGWPYRRTELNSFDFDAFMADMHPDVLDGWR